MSDNVHALGDGRLSKQGELVMLPGVVDAIEEILADAKSGEIAAVAIVGVNADLSRAILTRCTDAPTTAHALILIGQLEALKDRLLGMIETADEE